MEPTILYIIIGIVSVATGAILGKFIFAKNSGKLYEDAKAEAE